MTGCCTTSSRRRRVVPAASPKGVSSPTTGGSRSRSSKKDWCGLSLDEVAVSCGGNGGRAARGGVRFGSFRQGGDAPAHHHDGRKHDLVVLPDDRLVHHDDRR